MYEDELTNVFWTEDSKYASHNLSNSRLTGYRKFRAFYGISPETCSLLWKKIKDEHEHVNAVIAGVDEKTFRLWVWRFVSLLAALNVVKWENRLKNSKGNMHVTIDGTDYRIREPQPFNEKWYSHKFKGTGIRYEIAISIVGAEVVWATGGLPCGEWPDIKIAKNVYLHYAHDEITLADRGYRYKHYFKHPSNKIENVLLARHETLNGRLNEFSILSNRYRHPLKKHPLVFHALINAIQVSISNGEQLLMFKKTADESVIFDD